MAFARPSTLKFRIISRRDSRVLLVERDHATAEMYKLGLLLQGFSVDVAADGEEGIQRVLGGELPDVIVLDLGLPRIDQWTPRKDELEMLATLRSLRLTQSIPVVALSNNPEGFDDALQHGATECIAKWRITPRDLATEVHSLVRRSDEF
ncbi:MAG: response regulator transcription factor [Chloroflexi bacterium]|jgi:CheY-like chemotaxis protein|nr:MAG: response regulator transcription factor [Chloroflexota bacterium]